ncbi:putative membrane protein [Marinactinospora thermotolerans DSM 45154]|uniref:Putative membrane protein n=1 Tax=Marinactinospora thermotolerans DSM 45154 TaxID=1122192 RepID=A0A1T4QHE6_9ACTN|nr:YhgE/Pip domain-containing protein [Marinactinospora thermotolerans]SKA03066.1 putative membrane protein [Marinactinospora thermotolerans DSM 45154]
MSPRVLPSARVAGLGLLSFLRAPLPAATLAALILIPLLYSGLYLWSFWDPFDRLERLPVALVNEDRAVTVDGSRLHAGADLTDELLKRGDLDWHAVGAETAARGVADGSYYLSLTIPHDFSAHLATPADPEAEPVPAELEAHFNDANGYIVREVVGAVFVEIKDAAGATAAARYLDRIFLGFNEIHSRTEEAAHDTAKLAEGADDAKSGADRLASGLADVGDGAGELGSGLEEAKNGSASLASGTASADNGAHELGSGLEEAKNGSASLASGTASADNGAHELAASLAELDAGAAELASGATAASERVSAAADALGPIAAEVIPRLRDDAPAIQAGAGAVADAATALATALEELPTAVSAAEEGTADVGGRIGAYLDAHPRLAEDDPLLYALLTDARTAVDRAVAVEAFVRDNDERISAIAADATEAAALASAIAAEAPNLADDAEAAVGAVDELDAALAEIAEGARTLDDGLDAASAGAADLADGLDSLSQGASTLDDGLGDLGNGATTLADGLDDLNDGATTLADGLDDLDNGATTLADGLDDLDNGATTLADGLGDLSDGAHGLSEGVANGLDQIPTYDQGERSTHRTMMSDPVRLSERVDNEAPHYGTRFAPFFLPLSLWAGAMVTYLVLPAVSGRALASTARSWRVTLAGWLPAAAIGAGQVIVMLSVLHLALGLDARRWPATVALMVLCALSFAALIQWLNVQFGLIGRAIALVLLILQLTSSGGTYPLETSPGFFQTVAPFLPMNRTVAALRHLISGGQTAEIWQATALLTGYLVAALVLTWIAVARRRAWTLGRLHPTLVV